MLCTPKLLGNLSLIRLKKIVASPVFSMQLEFQTPSPHHNQQTAISNIHLQVNQTNQQLIGYSSNFSSISWSTRSKGPPKMFQWVTYGRHSHVDRPLWEYCEQSPMGGPEKTLQASTLFENVAATWFTQQHIPTKQIWTVLKEKLLKGFAH